MTSKTEVTLFQAVVNAAVSTAKGDDVLRKAFIAAGGDQAEPKRAVMLGRLMYSLKINQEDALKVLGKTGNPKHLTDIKDDVRTPTEEKACGAARGYLTACLKRWEIKSTEARGGDRKSPEATGAMDTEKLVLPKKIAIQNEVELGAYALAFAKSGYDLFLLNRTHKAVESEMGSNLMGLFADFLASVEDIVKV